MRAAVLLLCLASAMPAQAATWFVRPRTGEYGAEDGRSYATAWDGLSAVIWGSGGVQPGDTLYVCGTFDSTGESPPCLLTPRVDGASGRPVIIRGDYTGDPGYIIAAERISSWLDHGDGSYYASGIIGPCPQAWEGTPGGSEYVLEPKSSQAEVAATNGSFWYDSGTETFWYNPHSGPTNVFTSWTNAIWNNGRDYITYLNLRLYCGGSGMGVVQLDYATTETPATNLTVKGCTIKYASNAGIWAQKRGSDITITENSFHEFTEGINLNLGYTSPGADRVEVTRNYLDGGEAGYNRWFSDNASAAAICASPGNNWVVEENLVDRAAGHGILINRHISATGMQIRYNWIEDISDAGNALHSYGIAIDGPNATGYGDLYAGLVIAYNVVRNCSGDLSDFEGVGIWLKAGNPTVDTDRMRAIGNTLSNCNISFRASAETTGSRLGYIFQNNISHMPKAGGYHAHIGNASIRDPIMSHNCWYPDTSSGNNRFLWRLGVRTDFAAFAAAATADGAVVSPGSMTANPQFTNPAGGDFSVQAGSPAIDAGANLGDAYDDALDPDSDWPEAVVPIDQDNCGAGWEIGAYGYLGAAGGSYTLTVSASNGTVTKSPSKTTYAYGETVTLEAVPNTGYTFTGWSGDASGTANPTTITMNANKSVTAGFAAATYTLTISATNGTVTKSPNKTTYVYGETVTLEAVPNTGYTFTGWSGDASGTANPTTITMNTNKSVTAGFGAATYTLAISATNGTVTKSPNKSTYAHGETVTLEALPNTGYTFTGWSGDASGTANPTTITMNANKSVTAGFAAATYSLTISAANGTVTKSPSKTAYAYGETVTLEAAPNTGYTFTGWSGDASGTTNPTTITMNANKSVTAGFAAATYTLTVSAANGTVTKSPNKTTYAYGETVSLEAVPNTGYTFTGWSGDASGTANPTTITMNANKSVTAGFAAATYTLTISATNGTVTKSPNKTSYAYGETVTLEAVPSTGYTFTGWSGDASGTANPTTVTMNANKSVTAGFAAATYTLTVSASNGTVTKSPSKTAYAYGETVSLEAVPNTGYTFTGWSGDASGTANPTTITMNANKSVTAGFAAATYTLTVSASNGTVTKSPNKTAYAHGETVTLEAVPNTGYTFTGWSGDASGTTNPTTITMNANKSVTAGFAAATYTITISATNGTVTKSPNKSTYAHGETVTLEAVPNTGYTFTGWSGDASGTANPTTITMNANKSVTAGFAAATYTLTISATNGTVTKSPNKTTYAHGETVTLEAVPNTGYTFTGWSGDASGTTNPTTITMNANKSVTAGFAAATYTLTISATNGTVTKSPNKSTYAHGETVTLEAVPNTGYTFTGWSGDASGTANPTTITMNANKSVTAGFTRAVDDLPPIVDNCSPAPGSIQVPLNSLVSLHLRDQGAGVDAGSVSIRVNGELVYAGDVDSCPSTVGVCFRAGTREDYTYTYQQQTMYGESREIAVTVNARDLAGNVMPEQRYSFATEMVSFGRNRAVSTDQTKLGQARPVTVNDGRGVISILWEAGNAGSRHIYATYFRPDTDTVNSTVQVSRSAGDHCSPTAAIDSEGTLYVAWQEDARGVWDVYLATSADGISWSAPRRVVDPTAPADPPFNQVNPALSAGRKATALVAIAWQDDRAGNPDIYVARSTDAFATLAASRVTSDGTSQTDPAVAIDDQDTVFVLWTDTRNGSADLYGAASNTGPWTNTRVVGAPGSQSQVAVVAAPADSLLHMVWVDDRAGNLDVFHCVSEGLPSSPLQGTNIVDDTSGADQQMPALAAACRADGTDVVFACWEDSRNVGSSGDTDLYFADLSAGSVSTNVLVGDDGANSEQTEVSLGVNLDGYPYVVWGDDRGRKSQVFYAGATYMDPSPVADGQIVASTGGVVGTPPESVRGLDDVSVAFPAQACPFDARVRIRRMWNPQGYATESMRIYDFGPSGLTFSQPVTITIPYPSRGTNKVRAYWFDSATGVFTDQGVTNVRDITITSSLHALQFETTHFTPYLVSEEALSTAGGGGGGCSLAVAGEDDVAGYLMPYALLLVIMVGLRLRDARRAKAGTRVSVNRP